MADSDLVRQVRELERERDIFRAEVIGNRDNWCRELLERRHLLFDKLEREYARLPIGTATHHGAYREGVRDALEGLHWLCFGDDDNGDDNERF